VRVFHLILLVALMAVWGFSFVVMSVALRTLPPLALCVLRFFLAAFPSVFLLRRPCVLFWLAAVYGLFTFAIHYALVVTGLVINLFEPRLAQKKQPVSAAPP